MDLVIFLVVGLTLGFLAETSKLGRTFGRTGNIVVALLGGLVGGYGLDSFDIEIFGTFSLILRAACGSVVFLLMSQMFRLGLRENKAL